MVSGLVSALIGIKFPLDPLNKPRLQALATCAASEDSTRFVSEKLQSEFLLSCAYQKTTNACPMIFAASCLVRKSLGL